MTTDEVFQEIIKDKDWYKPFISSNNAYNIIRRHKAGEFRSYAWLFKKFGYEMEWKKKGPK